MGVHSSHWINARQTPEERRAKYRFLRICGYTYKQAQRMMDWSAYHIILNASSQLEELKKVSSNAKREKARQEKNG